MASTYTPAIGLELPARNDYKNTWDVPVNANFTAIDAKVGGTTSIALTNVNVTLTAAQARCANLIFTGVLTASLVVTLPAGSAGIFSVLNGTTGNFSLVLNTANAGAALSLQQGRRFLVISDGTNIYLADQALPPGLPLPWLSNAVPGGFILSYGQVLNQADQPGIYAVYGATFNTGGESPTQFRMPDLRGVTFAGLDNIGGAARGILTSFGSSGQTLGAFGGEQSHLLATTELPSHSHGVTDPGHAHPITDPGHNHSYGFQNNETSAGAGGQSNIWQGDTTGSTSTHVTGVTINNGATGISINNAGGGATHNNVQPTILGNWIVKT